MYDIAQINMHWPMQIKGRRRAARTHAGCAGHAGGHDCVGARDALPGKVFPPTKDGLITHAHRNASTGRYQGTVEFLHGNPKRRMMVPEIRLVKCQSPSSEILLQFPELARLFPEFELGDRSQDLLAFSRPWFPSSQVSAATRGIVVARLPPPPPPS